MDSRVLATAVFLAASVSTFAETISFSVPDWSTAYPNINTMLYDENGIFVAWGSAEIGAYYDENGDPLEPWTAEFRFTGVAPGNYSVGIDYGGTAFTPLQNFAQITQLQFAAFSESAPPVVAASPDDRTIDRNLHVLGNVITFGTAPATATAGTRLTFKTSTNTLDTLVPHHFSYYGSGALASMTWSFLNEAMGGVETPRMTLTADGALYLSPEGSMSPVMTLSSSDARYMRTNPTTIQITNGVRIGSATLAGTASLGGGSGAKVYGDNSLAFGSGATVGATTSVAHSAVALGANSLALKEGAMAFGKGAKALKNQSIAIGQDAESSGDTSLWWQTGYDWGSIAVGTKARALGIGSTAFGSAALAEGPESIALGPRSRTANNAGAGIALGWEAAAWGFGGMAFGNSANAAGFFSGAFGNGVFAMADQSTVLGSYADTNTRGQVVVGVAPDFHGLGSDDWDDMNAEVFVVGAGKPGPFIGGTIWGLEQWGITRRTALSIKRSGELNATGTVNSAAEGPGKYNKFRAPILVPESGDISMGEFTAGENPNPQP